VLKQLASSAKQRKYAKPDPKVVFEFDAACIKTGLIAP
jgi:hypothetical protein